MKNIFLLVFGTLFSIQFAVAQVEYTATGGGNFFTLAYPANVTSLTPGLSFTFKANHTITGSATLNVNGLGNVTIKKEVTQNLVASDILSGQIVTVVFDGTNFQMTSKAGTSGGSLNSVIQDADGNTSINVEASPDQDVIHFNLGGNTGYPGAEYFTMIGPRLEVINSGNSVFIGSGAGANDDLTANSNVFVGENSGNLTNTGDDNVGVGSNSLSMNTTGIQNVAIGDQSMSGNLDGGLNVAVGQESDNFNQSGYFNVSLGAFAGNGGAAHTKNGNVLIGMSAGLSLGNGADYNVMNGYYSGNNTTTGTRNVFVGSSSGAINVTGSDNTFFGNNSNPASSSLNNATAIGANAEVGADNSMVLGSINGVNSATSSTKVGIGTTTPAADLDVVGSATTIRNYSFSSAALIDGGNFHFIRTRGTATVPASVVASDNIGTVSARGHDGSTIVTAARIDFDVDGVPGTNDMPGSISFKTTLDGTSSSTERMIIKNDGRVGIGTNSPAATLDVTGTDAVILPQGSDAQRPAVPENGMIRYNTTSSQFEGYENGAWVLLVSGSGGGTRLEDTDNNTYIEVDSPGDGTENEIHFVSSGTEYFTMIGSRIEVINANNGTYMGDNSGLSNPTGISNSGYGFQTLRNTTTGQHNTAIGANSLLVNTTGGYNVGIGSQSLQNGNGDRNIGIGFRTLMSNTMSDNIAIGYQALTSNTSAQNNTAVGSNALSMVTTGGNNTAIGFNSMAASTGFQSTAVGSSSLQANTTGTNNNAFGLSALGGNTTGGSNSAFGNLALQLNTTGQFNSAFGNQSLSSSTGANNTAIGYDAGTNNTTGFTNLFVGYNANPSGGALNNASAIGPNAIVSQSNSMVLGDGTINVGIGTSLPSTILHLNGGHIRHEGTEPTATGNGVNTGSTDVKGAVAVNFAPTGSISVTFTEVFNSIPTIVCTPVCTGDPSANARYWLSNVTTGGFTINWSSSNSTSAINYTVIE